MGRYSRGTTISALVLAATIAAASGCSSSDDTDQAKPATTVDTVDFEKATSTFKASVEKFDADGGCLEKEPGTCWEQMQAVMTPARTLRRAMNMEKSVGADFWTGAYALINTMEKGIAVGEDRGTAVGVTNRPDVLGSAHELVTWLNEHPVK
ncbi:hypothetical protein ACGFR8_31530 [Streptomyces brevispora]|uniref:hypothetical protein n=1 Tax=Streptomyces brevispora TaxID=887462 RepID=UPI00371C1728